MVKLEDVKVKDGSPDLSDTIMSELRGVFNGDTLRVEEFTPLSPDKGKVRVSFVDILVLIAVILVITSGSVKFMVSDTVSNYFVLNTLHSVVIAILFYVYVRITS